MKPLRPEDVAVAKAETIPDKVIEVVNNLIAQKWNGSTATLTQDEILDAIVSYVACSRQYVLDNNWLDFEEVYRDVGWSVAYDKPGYCEHGIACFRFSKPIKIK